MRIFKSSTGSRRCGLGLLCSESLLRYYVTHIAVPLIGYPPSGSADQSHAHSLDAPCLRSQHAPRARRDRRHEQCDAGDYARAIAIFGGAGAGLGALVGLLIKTDRWEEVPLNRFRVSFAPQRDGRFALGASVSF